MELQTMVATIGKWGNSLAVRIPQQIAKEIKAEEGTEIDLDVVDGAIVIKPKSRRRRYSLEEMVQGITPENCHAEIESGKAVGNEIW
jgi:antitoxin MazE